MPANFSRRAPSNSAWRSLSGFASVVIVVWLSIVVWWLSGRLQRFRLVVGNQPFYDFVDLTLHNTVELINGEIDAVIRQPSLVKVIGSDPLAAVAASDHEFARRCDLGALFFLFLFQQSSAQDFHALGPILVLRFFILAGYNDPARDMRDAHGRIRRIDALAAGARGAEHIDANILRVDLNFHFIGFGHHGDGDRGGVDAPRALRDRNPLHPVHSAFEFEPAVSALSFDAGNDLFEAAETRGIGAHHFDSPTARLGVTAVHSEELSGEFGILPLLVQELRIRHETLQLHVSLFDFR